MDDVNINKICLGIEEVELDGEEREWIKLNWISSQSDDDENFQFSPETQEDSDNGMAQVKDCDSKVSFTNESEDISDGISVITDSDTDVVNTNLFQICRFKPQFKSPQMLKVQLSRQKDIWNIFIACVFGIIIGMALSYLFTTSETRPVSGDVDAESIRTASHNIVNTCKELTDVKTMLNEIKAHIPTDKKITKQFLAQFFEITDSSNKIRSKPIITKKFFNSTPHSLDQLQESLHVLSSLASIYNDNSSLKNEINKSLDIINNTKVFYDTLVLYTNNTQNEFNPVILNFLQHNNDKMHITSKLLLSNLVEKMSKVTSKIYNKYVKEKHRLNKKLCHLKNILPDDKFLKQLTENNQLFKDYDKSCFSNYTSKNLDGRTITKENTKPITKENTKIKEQKTNTVKTNTVLHPRDKKDDTKNIHIIHDNNKDSLKNKNNKKQNVDKYITKFLQNTIFYQKIHNTSQLFISEVVENISKLRRQLNKKLHHLKNILPNSEFLKQLMEDDESDNKESIKCCEEKDNYVHSKNDISKNSFDNILMQLKNMCPLSTNYCPKFNINMSTFDTVPNYKTKNYKYKKQEKNKKIVDHRGSAEILPTEEQSRSKKKDYFKSNGSTKKIVSDKANYEEKNNEGTKEKNNISQNKEKDHTIYHHESKHSSLDSHTMKQDKQHYTNIDRKSDSKRFDEHKKQRQLDDSDWYFRRAHSRKDARRHAEYIY